MRSRPVWRPLPPASTLVVVAAVAVLVGSLLPLPGASEGVSLVGPLGIGADKWVHAASYTVVAGLAAASRDWRRLALALAAVVVGVAVFGVGIEVAQSFVPGRTASVADAVANTVGAVAGVVGWWLLVRRNRHSLLSGTM